LAKESLTLQDLSSVAAIMIGKMWVLFSSLDNYLAIYLMLSKLITLTESCSSLVNYLN